MRKLVLSFNIEKFKRNQIVYKQGDKADMIFIAFDGEFMATRKKKNNKPFQSS